VDTHDLSVAPLWEPPSSTLRQTRQLELTSLDRRTARARQATIAACDLTKKAMLSLQNLSKAYPGATARRVLTDVSLDLSPGDCVAVMGDSGAGKSTLLNIIAGLDTPDAGNVIIGRSAITQMDEQTRTLFRRARIGFVFQAFHLLPHMTVAGNIGLPLALNGVPDLESQQRVSELLVAVGLNDRANSFPRELSGGEMQRVAVARALVHRPVLVLADEPTGNLDAESAFQVLGLLREQVKRSNAILILVTHSRTAARTMDRVLRLTVQGLQAAP
jgi:putative ABC transport system ATP-binding protein